MPDAVKGKEGIIEGIKEGIIDSGIARLGVIKIDNKGDAPNYLPVPQFTGSFLKVYRLISSYISFVI